MAMASMHTISVLGESPRQVPRQVVAEGSQRTQASSVMQMWRNIEDVHTRSPAEQRTKLLRHKSDEFNDDISTQTSESNCSEQRAYLEEIAQNIGCSNLSGSQNRLKAGDQDGREKSPAIGETERERVRRIFHEWMKCGGREHSSPPQMGGSSRAQWLADNECERARVVREWVQLTAQDRGSDSGKKEVTETRSEIGEVRDELVVNQNESRPNRVHRKIRKLCGKQALLDLLAKAEKERQDDLQDLIKHHAVSRFPHRNRIQALLKGRFLRNNISSEKPKTRSTAAGELGLLRQRQTVSGLREGFLSRTESSSQSQHGSANEHLPFSSHTNANGTDKTDINTKEEMTEKFHERDDSTKDDHNIPDSRSVLVDSEEARFASDRSRDFVNEQELHDDEVNRQQSAGAELTTSSPGTVAEESLQANITNESSQGREREQHDVEVFTKETHDINALSCGPSDTINQGSGICETSTRMNDVSCVNVDEDFNSQRHATDDEQLAELDFDNDIGRMDRVAYNDWRTLNNDAVDVGRIGNAHGQSLEAPEHASLLSDRHGTWGVSDSEESVEDLLQRNSRQNSGAFASSDTFYGSEDNVRTSELNELVVRRTVSNLLESGFRVSLNRLLQTYVERQVHASMGWDLNDSISYPPSELLHHEQQSDNLNENYVDTFAPFSRSGHTTPHIRREQNWDQVPWMHMAHQPHGFQDWEVISDLRMDITSLQLRMNDMQRMLEACMDMQLELQRSIRQEVSAALNRSVSPVDPDVADEKSKWELVRKGVCCVCSQSSIDSLLYRCGHMCTCTKCANKLFDEKSKCPMCRSPIVEVIRAYSIQQ